MTGYQELDDEESASSSEEARGPEREARAAARTVAFVSYRATWEMPRLVSSECWAENAREASAEIASTRVSGTWQQDTILYREARASTE